MSNDISQIADFDMVMRLERLETNIFIYEVQIDLMSNATWFKDLLSRKTDFVVMSSFLQGKGFYICHEEYYTDNVLGGKHNV